MRAGKTADDVFLPWTEDVQTPIIVYREVRYLRRSIRAIPHDQNSPDDARRIMGVAYPRVTYF